MDSFWSTLASALKGTINGGAKSGLDFISKKEIPIWNESERYARAAFPFRGQVENLATPGGVYVSPSLNDDGWLGLSNRGTIKIAPSEIENLKDFHPSSGVLAHELTHDLTNKMARYLNHESVSKQIDLANYIAKVTTERLGPYNPMYAVPAGNQNDNYHEQLAERVQQPLTDAMEVGRRFNKLKALLPQYVPAPQLPNYFNPNKVS